MDQVEYLIDTRQSQCLLQVFRMMTTDDNLASLPDDRRKNILNTTVMDTCHRHGTKNHPAIHPVSGCHRTNGGCQTLELPPSEATIRNLYACLFIVMQYRTTPVTMQSLLDIGGKLREILVPPRSRISF
jgi:hypothetical protein